MRQKAADAEIAALDQPQSECCYARSDKYWITDPQGIAWETYHTLGEVEVYGVNMPKTAAERACMLRTQAECSPYQAGARKLLLKIMSECCSSGNLT